MNPAIALCVDNARRSHHVAVWAAKAFREFLWHGYAEMAEANHRRAYEYLEEARRLKAAKEAA